MYIWRNETQNQTQMPNLKCQFNPLAPRRPISAANKSPYIPRWPILAASDASFLDRSQRYLLINFGTITAFPLLYQGQTVDVSMIRAKTGTFSIETLDVHLAPWWEAWFGLIGSSRHTSFIAWERLGDIWVFPCFSQWWFSWSGGHALKGLTEGFNAKINWRILYIQRLPQPIPNSGCYWPCRNPCLFDVELATQSLSLF
jgi:hypothetical protein